MANDMNLAPGERAAAAAEAVWRITGIAGFDETLSSELRSRAIEILALLAALTAHPGALNAAPDNAEVLGRYRRLMDDVRARAAGVIALLKFGLSQRAITATNADMIIGAYQRISDSLQESPGRHLEEPTANEGIAAFNTRQKRILAYLGEHRRAPIADLTQLFSGEFSEKTLKRELGDLIVAGLIRRSGDNRWTIYSLTGDAGGLDNLPPPDSQAEIESDFE